MYQLRFTDNSRSPLLISSESCTIGSAADNHHVLSSPLVDSCHARLLSGEDGLVLQDNRSLAGCMVNGDRIASRALQVGDVVTIGDVELAVEMAQDQQQAGADTPLDGAARAAVEWSLVSDCNWQPGTVFPLTGEMAILGRGKDCDIVVPGSHLSRRHAELIRRGDELFIRDLASANGSFVNEARVSGEQQLAAGDRLRFDVYSFKVQGPEESELVASVPEAEVSGSIHHKAIDLEKTLQDMKRQEFQQKEWVTKPTSHGNRYHEVPVRKDHFGALFWFSVVLGLAVVGVLAYILLSMM